MQGPNPFLLHCSGPFYFTLKYTVLKMALVFEQLHAQVFLTPLVALCTLRLVLQLQGDLARSPGLDWSLL